MDTATIEIIFYVAGENNDYSIPHIAFKNHVYTISSSTYSSQTNETTFKSIIDGTEKEIVKFNGNLQDSVHISQYFNNKIPTSEKQIYTTNNLNYEMNANLILGIDTSDENDPILESINYSNRQWTAESSGEDNFILTDSNISSLKLTLGLESTGYDFLTTEGLQDIINSRNSQIYRSDKIYNVGFSCPYTIYITPTVSSYTEEQVTHYYFTGGTINKITINGIDYTNFTISDNKITVVMGSATVELNTDINFNSSSAIVDFLENQGVIPQQHPQQVSSIMSGIIYFQLNIIYENNNYTLNSNILTWGGDNTGWQISLNQGKAIETQKLSIFKNAETLVFDISPYDLSTNEGIGSCISISEIIAINEEIQGYLYKSITHVELIMENNYEVYSLKNIVSEWFRNNNLIVSNILISDVESIYAHRENDNINFVFSITQDHNDDSFLYSSNVQNFITKYSSSITTQSSEKLYQDYGIIKTNFYFFEDDRTYLLDYLKYQNQISAIIEKNPEYLKIEDGTILYFIEDFSNVNNVKQYTINNTSIDKYCASGGSGSIYSGTHDSLFATSNGFYLAYDGLSIGSKVYIDYTGIMKIGSGAVTKGTGAFWVIDGSKNNNYSYIGYNANSSCIDGGDKISISNAANSNSVYLGTDGIRLGTKFAVDNGGNLIAKNAYITGSSYLGNWKISEGKIVGTGITLDAAGRIHSQNWSINGDGSAIFSKVTITSDSGHDTTIGDLWVNSSGGIQSANFKVNESGFKLDSNGNLFAMNANLGGIIKATGGTIGGIKITGSGLSGGGWHLNGNGGKIGGWTIGETQLSNGHSSLSQHLIQSTSIKAQSTLQVGEMNVGAAIKDLQGSHTGSFHGTTSTGVPVSGSFEITL